MFTSGISPSFQFLIQVTTRKPPRAWGSREDHNLPASRTAGGSGPPGAEGLRELLGKARRILLEKEAIEGDDLKRFAEEVKIHAATAGEQAQAGSSL